MAGGGGEGENLEYTPTWVVAAVCTVIVAISLAVERALHYGGIYLKKKKQKPLFEALQKVKEELMLLGFISLLLTVSQNFISKICVKQNVVSHMLPCSLKDKKKPQHGSDATPTTEHLQEFLATTIARRLLAEGSSEAVGYCAKKGKVPLLSIEAIHHLHIFIFVLAIVHVTFCALTVLFGGAKIRQWHHWEKSIAQDRYDTEEVLKQQVTHVHQHAFIKEHFLGIGKDSALMGWLISAHQRTLFHSQDFLVRDYACMNNLDKVVHLYHPLSFFKQFYASVTRSDYITLRLGFIMTHCRGNPKFNFHRYMLRALEDDFKKVVGISWYLWVFVVVFLLLNVSGWHTYFWIAFIPFILSNQHVSTGLGVINCTNLGYFLLLAYILVFQLLLAVGTKLEHVITQLAYEVAEKHVAIEGELVVQPSDDHFWFHKPGIILFLIHFILFQNAFEIAFFFWIWVQYGFDSCIMGQVRYIIPRLVIGVFIQVLCSYSTLPLYAIVTQMGSSFKKAIFEEHVQVAVVGWAQKARQKKEQRAGTEGSTEASSHTGSTVGIQLGKLRGLKAAEGSAQSTSHTGSTTGDASAPGEILHSSGRDENR
ncbi:MLO-like protein 1 [Turnera subulata]|uniref:MLO-like protein n=1 Tax=Turnera subulata TaxID=218843 RepID=A0A9Q0G6V5_9ROSI|nr:MLO-like protein 1 [Turnera subulata]